MNIILATLITLTTLTANAAGNIETKVRVISDTTTPTELQLDATTVRCSALGYGNTQLKVSAPALKYLSFFDHVNEGESVPCITAGMCRPNFGPGNVIRADEPVAKTEITVVLREEFQLDHERKLCRHRIIENVLSEIRGITFRHQRSGNLGPFPYELCQKL